MAPIKVVHLTSVHAAGDTRIAHKECATLARAGYDVVIVAPGERRSMPDGVRHHQVPAPANRLGRFTRTMWDVFRAARQERAAVYHFHDPELIGVGAALRLSGARVIFDVHEDIPLDIECKPWIPPRVRPAVKWCASVVLRVAQQWFTAIVPATPSIAQGFTHDRVVIVRNYPIGEELRFEGGAPFAQRPKIALYAGTIALLRGVERMVRAIDHPSLPDDARLSLAGTFEDSTLQPNMSKLPGWSRTIVAGHLSRSALAAEMARARMGLLLLLPDPSHVEAMPTKLYEYMSAALPVIATKFINECRDVVEENECGILVDPRNVDEIAAAMKYLFERPEEAQAMGERGRIAMRDRYDWKTEGRRLVDLYAAVAS